MADVFISYAKGDGAAVRRLAEAVARLGYSVRWDEEPAAAKIEEARAAIVVWSEAAAGSQRVRAEADLARSQGKLVQASVDGRLPPMPFNQLQCAALGDWRGAEDHQGWQKVKASLAALAGPREPVEQPPPPAPARAARLVPALIALALALAALIVFMWPRR